MKITAKHPKWNCITCGVKCSDGSYHRNHNPGHELLNIKTGKPMGIRSNSKVAKRPKKFLSVLKDEPQENDNNLAVQVSYAAGYVASWLNWYARDIGVSIPSAEFTGAVIEVLKGGK